MAAHPQAKAFVLRKTGGCVPEAIDVALADVVLAKVCSLAVLTQIAWQVTQGLAVQFQPLGDALGPKAAFVYTL